jgi:hypothetical protein
MSDFLSLYTSAEAEASDNCGFLVSETFKNAYFIAKGRLTVEENFQRSLWKYLDSHHDGRLNLVIEKGLGGRLSEVEASLLGEVLQRTRAFCAKYRIDFSVRNGALFRALYQFRGIYARYGQRISRGERPIVLEIGPGSGFLTTLLAMAGFRVYCLENTSSHYLYQNAFLSSVFEQEFCETGGSSTFECPTFFNHEGGSVIHVPWWKIVNGFPADVEIVASNHMLQECHVWAFEAYMRYGSSVLFKNTGTWFIEGVGAGYHGGPQISRLKEELEKSSFVESRPLMRDTGLLDVYVCYARSRATDGLDYPKVIPIDLVDLADAFPALQYEPRKITSAEFLKSAGIPH